MRAVRASENNVFEIIESEFLLRFRNEFQILIQIHIPRVKFLIVFAKIPILEKDG